MILKLYSIKDKLVGFTGPVALKDDKIAERWFYSICKQKKEQEFTDSKYYELYEIGTFDTETGSSIGLPTSQIKLLREGEQFDGKDTVRDKNSEKA